MKNNNLIGISGKQKSGKDTVAKMIQYLTFYNTPDRVSFNELFEYELKYSDWQIKKFAYKIKQIASILTGIPVEDFEKQEVKNMELGEEWWYKMGYDVGWDKEWTNEGYTGIENEVHTKCFLKPAVRNLLQLIGTEAFRDNVHPNTWVNALFADYKPEHFRVVKNEEGVVIDHLTTLPKWLITDVRFPNEVKAIKDRNGILIRVNRYMGTQLMGSKEYHESETALDSYKDWDYEINNNGSLSDLLDSVKEICKQEGII
jgi:hypothetical protein